MPTSRSSRIGIARLEALHATVQHFRQSSAGARVTHDAFDFEPRVADLELGDVLLVRIAQLLERIDQQRGAAVRSNWVKACTSARRRSVLRRRMDSMIAALVVCAPRLGYRFLFIALFVAAYPLWHADFPTVRVVQEIEIPPMDAETPIPARSDLLL